MSITPDGCGRKNCRASSGICEEPTFGVGGPDDNGYFEKGCYACARAFEKLYPEYGICWPPPKRSLNLARTRAALEVWDAGAAERLALFDEAETDAQFAQVQARDLADADKVREAFAEDTAGVNSRDRAMLVHPDAKWLRDLVAQYGGSGSREG